MSCVFHDDDGRLRSEFCLVVVDNNELPCVDDAGLLKDGGVSCVRDDRLVLLRPEFCFVKLAVLLLGSVISFLRLVVGS